MILVYNYNKLIYFDQWSMVTKLDFFFLSQKPLSHQELFQQNFQNLFIFYFSGNNKWALRIEDMLVSEPEEPSVINWIRPHTQLTNKETKAYRGGVPRPSYVSLRRFSTYLRLLGQLNVYKMSVVLPAFNWHILKINWLRRFILPSFSPIASISIHVVLRMIF